jgi:hypothetical protein
VRPVVKENAMFTKRPVPFEIEKLNEAIDDIYRSLAGLDAESEEYGKASDQLVKLMKLKKEYTPSRWPSSDTMALAAANLLGIGIIVGYERAHVVTSKALGFVGRMK